MTEPEGAALSPQERLTSVAALGQVDAEPQTATTSDVPAPTGPSANSRYSKYCLQARSMSGTHSLPGLVLCIQGVPCVC